MSAAHRWLGVAAASLVITALAAGAPHALRRVDDFRVATVEVRGVRLMDPSMALDALDLPPGASVFDDFEPWHARLLEHPLVAGAHITRRLPDTIVLEITETEPVALVRTPELRPVDVRGRLLPIGPGAATLDLPVLGGRAAVDDTGMLSDETQRALLQTLATVKAAEPALAEWV
jgi:cell division protein FtsQ